MWIILVGKYLLKTSNKDTRETLVDFDFVMSQLLTSNSVIIRISVQGKLQKLNKDPLLLSARIQ